MKRACETTSAKSATRCATRVQSHLIRKLTLKYQSPTSGIFLFWPMTAPTFPSTLALSRKNMSINNVHINEGEITHENQASNAEQQTCCGDRWKYGRIISGSRALRSFPTSHDHRT